MSKNFTINLVELHKNEPRISHKIIAQETQNQELSVRKLIDKYSKDIEEFGVLVSKIDKPSKNSIGGRPIKTFYLNKQQTNFLLISMKLSVKLTMLFAKYGDSFKAIEEYSKIKDNFQKAFVYIVQFDNKNLKIGFSSNPTKRLRTLETQSGNLIKNRLLLKFNSKKEALEQEKQLHQQFSKFRTHGEYFDISFEEVIKQI